MNYPKLEPIMKIIDITSVISINYTASFEAISVVPATPDAPAPAATVGSAPPPPRRLITEQ